MKGAHHPVYKPQRGFKTWKEKKKRSVLPSNYFGWKKITDSETYVELACLSNQRRQIDFDKSHHYIW